MAVVFYAAALVGISLAFRVDSDGHRLRALVRGLGMVLIAAVGWVFFGQRLDLAGTLGLALIFLGVAIIKLLLEVDRALKPGLTP